MAGRTSREDKQRIALALIQKAGDLVEFWSEMAPDCPDIDAETARKHIAAWLTRLPGDAWDSRLDPPNLPAKEN